MPACIVDDCVRTDMAPHPRGGDSYHCFGHESKYMDCEECGLPFISCDIEAEETEWRCDECQAFDQ